MMNYFRRYESPLGLILLSSDGEALTGLWFEGQKHCPSFFSKTAPEKDLHIFAETTDWLNRYFNKIIPDFTPELHPFGTAFQQTVWNLLLSVPYGETVSYGEIAQRTAIRLKRTGMPARAVGSAIGRNPISLIIPCHRVVGSDGSLTGYAGGLERKRKLLELEKVSISR